MAAISHGEGQTQDAIERWLREFTTWAQRQRDVRAAWVVGSRARTVQPADEWSDVDIMLVTTRPRRYLHASAWLRDIGSPWMDYLIETQIGARNVRHAVFEGAVCVDFAILSSLETRWASPMLRLVAWYPRLMRLLPSGLATQAAAWFQILRKGAPLVLVDKEGAAARMTHIPVDKPVRRPITEREFSNVVGGFWSLSMWTAKQQLRGQLWMANYECAYELRTHLLRMIEWHARAVHGTDYDTWYWGRFLERWADPRAVAALRDVFSRYDARSSREALFASMELFSWLARETAERLRFSYPGEAEEAATRWLRARLSPVAREG